MQDFAERAGALLCPHGKTTMSPRLFARQLAAGAWGITLATLQQVRVARAHGVRRILYANELTQSDDVRYVREELERDPELDFYCLVDSGGSAYFDLVAEELSGLPAQLVLRSGCYVTHDHGHYARLAAGRGVELRPALEVWAHVLSVPEPELVILSAGRRDSGQDAGDPVPIGLVDDDYRVTDVLRTYF